MYELDVVKIEKMTLKERCLYKGHIIGSNDCVYGCEYCNKDLTLSKNGFVYCNYKFENMYDIIKERLRKEFREIELYGNFKK